MTDSLSLWNVWIFPLDLITVKESLVQHLYVMYQCFEFEKKPSSVLLCLLSDIKQMIQFKNATSCQSASSKPYVLVMDYFSLL